MQLTFEMTNLQLLLEGALSDRFVLNQRIIKPRTTLGFPITITPQTRYKDAVAVVEVEVTGATSLSPEPPSLTVLLPREKTYNVAAITDRMTSIGGGAVVGTVGVSGSFLSGRKTYFIVQDQDTVALQLPSTGSNTSFAWEFRPVLGQHFVRGGLKQTFAQLALPLLASAGDCFGTIRRRTYWRTFDSKQGVSGNMVEGSLLQSAITFPLPHYDLTPNIRDIQYRDLGDGNVLATVLGSFLAGTYIQLGATRFDVSNGLIIDGEALRLSLPRPPWRDLSGR
jgi:hypothetical protein